MTTTQNGQMIRYLTGATGQYLDGDGLALRAGIGLLIQPGSGYRNRLDRYPAWAADNGAFSKVKVFDPDAFRSMLRDPRCLDAQSSCLFVTAPDELVVLPDGTVIGDAQGTLDKFPSWAREIHELGYPVALVAQDGLEDLLDEVPWDEVDVLFLGGSTEWKIGPGAQACIAAAQAHGKRTHMGRVNSLKRLRIADGWGVDTADGTYIGYGPSKNLPNVLGWIDAIRNDHTPEEAIAA